MRFKGARTELSTLARSASEFILLHTACQRRRPNHFRVRVIGKAQHLFTSGIKAI